MDGTARFADPHTLEVDGPEGTRRLSADFILIGCGSRPAHNPKVPVDGKSILDSDQIEGMERLHREAIIVGAGVIGLEYASMSAALGSRVTVIEQRDTILDFVDREIVDALVFYLRQSGVTFRLGETLVSVRRESESQVVACLESGKEVRAEILLYTVGRQTNADLLNLPGGPAADPCGRPGQRALPDGRRTLAAGDATASSGLARPRCIPAGSRATTCSGSATRAGTPLPTASTISRDLRGGQTEEELTKSKTRTRSAARYEWSWRGADALR